MNLEQTAVTLADQFGSGHESNNSVDRFFEKFGAFAFAGLGVVLVTGIGFLLYTIFTQMLLEGGRIGFAIFLMLFIVFAALSLVYVIFNEIKKDNDKKRAAHASEPVSIPELQAPDTGRLLNEPSQMPVPSVTENTTDLLKVEARTRKL